ncbi:hypothetical protein P7M41_25140 [Vibrio parahaemolyticus]|uniref:hypothetical protein n=1 Tax=Vibrio parahaemolyticus TaxID=670 RepID=UPI0015DE6BFC|nr:hypothetical protein [Vibrio parahaemolyticus]MDF4264794.1 hypothetical protein [Vibrio parahaemolyticus]MDF4326731.1 hypothetical protein [Vibrio parahaemolyticus]MDG2555302.1 hypothetical protein [Vibrio parahaemolyticus]
MNSKEVVVAFWEAMKTNDFAKASEWLSPDFEGVWPEPMEAQEWRSKWASVVQE